MYIVLRKDDPFVEPRFQFSQTPNAMLSPSRKQKDPKSMKRMCPHYKSSSQVQSSYLTTSVTVQMVHVQSVPTIRLANIVAQSKESSSGSTPSWQFARDRFRPRDRRVRARSYCIERVNRSCPRTINFHACPGSSVPDLQSSRTEHARTFVLGQVWSGRTLVVGHFLLARLLHHFARVSSIGVARNHDVLAIHSGLVGIFSFDTLFALEILLVNKILRLILIEDLLMRLVVEAVTK